MDKVILEAAVFNNLRLLNRCTPQDTYVLNYKWHLEECRKKGIEFFDLYCLGWWWGSTRNPKKILDIGVRTGTSLCQLLSACSDYEDKRVVQFDVFNDGLSCPELVKKHLNYLGIPTEFIEKIEFHTGDSKETVPRFKETNVDLFDWVLVDGDHSNEGAKIDLNNVVDLVAPGGIIVFDDIASTVEKFGFNLRPTWNEFKEENYNNFMWYEDHAAKGTAWGIRL